MIKDVLRTSSISVPQDPAENGVTYRNAKKDIGVIRIFLFGLCLCIASTLFGCEIHIVLSLSPYPWRLIDQKRPNSEILITTSLTQLSHQLSV